MNIVKVGDTQKDACYKCKSFQAVTFKLRDTPFSDGSGIVKNILVGVCNQCDSTIVIPHQSTPAIKRQLENQRVSLESRVPAHMIDILNLACDHLGGGPEFIPNILKFYIHSLSHRNISPLKIASFLNTRLAKGKSQKRISLKGNHLSEDLNTLKKLTKIKTTADLIKSIVLKINDDILVKKKAKVIYQLKNILVSTT